MQFNASRMWTLVAAAVAFASPLASQQPAVSAAPFVAGKHYAELPSPQPTSTAKGQVEVAEIFMYGCPHCFAFEPHLQRWLEHKPDYVNFIRIPAPWNPMAVMHAKAFYAAAALGKSGEIDGPFFAAIHEQGNFLDSEDKLVAFFAAHGVDAAKFKEAFNSFDVNTKVNKAEELVARYRVQGTPNVVVNGKYVTSGAMSGSYDTWFAIIDDLAAREHAAVPTGGQ